MERLIYSCGTGIDDVATFTWWHFRVTTRSTLSSAIVTLAISGAASGSSIMYEFTVDATSGVLSGDTASGSSTFDSGAIPSRGGTVGATNLLTGLNFRWDGITYNASTANTGWLTFNSKGRLTFFTFGNACISLACAVDSPSADWLASPGAAGFVYSSGGPFGFGKVSYSLGTSVPEPATLGLLSVSLATVGFALRKRKLYRSRGVEKKSASYPMRPSSYCMDARASDPHQAHSIELLQATPTIPREAFSVSGDTAVMSPGLKPAAVGPEAGIRSACPDFPEPAVR